MSLAVNQSVSTYGVDIFSYKLSRTVHFKYYWRSYVFSHASHDKKSELALLFCSGNCGFTRNPPDREQYEYQTAEMNIRYPRGGGGGGGGGALRYKGSHTRVTYFVEEGVFFS